jgi:hemerythrin
MNAAPLRSAAGMNALPPHAPAEMKESEKPRIQKRQVTNGVYWVEIPEAGLFVLCGCPADSVKHLMKQGLITDGTRAGVAAQTGPNAILLSDTTIQKSSFSNLAEFPVLQMLYLQGMILPGHPNNTGRKPMLIGLEDQVRSQSLYIYRGTYGLASLEEIMEAGVPQPLAADMLRIKRWFAFDNIRRTEDLLDLRVVDTPAVELRAGAFVRRKGFNLYEFIYGGSSVTVDLNLGESEQYPPTYTLGFHRLRREDFSVVHIGEGDGWDVTRPCMGSILCHRGRLYLIDTGPGIQYSLTAMGISINEVAGIFATHGHDDHFAGLTSMVRTDHRIPYYAATPIRTSVVKKYAALTGRNEATFYQYFEPHDLPFDTWSAVEEMEVMPVFSPHPVETNVFFFRAAGAEGRHTYSHLADISAFEVLKKMVTADASRNGMSYAFYDTCTRKLLQPTDIKKIDIGGGLIHGKAEDFRSDGSGSRFLSHTSAPLNGSQKQIGSCAVFGQQDVLIPSRRDYLQMDGMRYLQSYFPQARAEGLAPLVAGPLAEFPPDAVIVAAGAPAGDIFLVLSGMVEQVDATSGLRTTVSAGGFLAEIEGFSGEASARTCRARSHVTVMRFSRDTYREFLRGTGLIETVQAVHTSRQFLMGTWLFGEMVSLPLQLRIAQATVSRKVREGDVLAPEGRAEVVLLADGLVTVFLGPSPIENLRPQDFFGEETLMRQARELPAGWQQRFRRLPRPGTAQGHHLFEGRATLDSVLLAVPAEVIEDIPVVQWKLMETYERRLKSIRTEMHFKWNDSYAVGISDIDEQHGTLFEMIDGAAAAAEGRENASFKTGDVDRLVELAGAHLKYEEALASRSTPPGYASALKDHVEFSRKMDVFRRYVPEAPADALQAMVEFLKDWVVDHVLLENRRFRECLKS